MDSSDKNNLHCDRNNSVTVILRKDLNYNENVLHRQFSNLRVNSSLLI